MPSTSSSSAPGMAAAVARPPETCTILSARPWTTSVGHAHARAAGGAVGLGQHRQHLAQRAAGARRRGRRSRRRRCAGASSWLRVAGRADQPPHRARCCRRTPRGRAAAGRSSAGNSRGCCQPTVRLPVVDMMLVSERTRAGSLDRHRLHDHPAHRHADDVGDARSRGGRAARTRRAPGRSCEYGARTRAPAKARTSIRAGHPAGDLGGPADVAVVEADHVVAAPGQHRAELGVPPVHRAGQAHHAAASARPQGRRTCGSTAPRRSRPGRRAPARPPPMPGRRRPVAGSRAWRRRDRPCHQVNRMVATRQHGRVDPRTSSAATSYRR